jgi:hypothetical protein
MAVFSLFPFLVHNINTCATMMDAFHDFTSHICIAASLLSLCGQEMKTDVQGCTGVAGDSMTRGYRHNAKR